MIENNVLFQGIFIPCLSHEIKEIDEFMAAFELSLLDYSVILYDGYENTLKGKQTKAVFRKYN